MIKPSHHKHIKILIKRTHHGTHISSIKCVASLNILLLTGSGNFWVTSVSKTHLPQLHGKTVAILRVRLQGFTVFLEQGTPLGLLPLVTLWPWALGGHTPTSTQTGSCSSAPRAMHILMPSVPHPIIWWNFLYYDVILAIARLNTHQR